MARLPQPGGDSGNWGDILNDFLSQSLKADGTIKENAVTAAALAPGVVSAGTIADGTITSTQLAGGSIQEAKLSSTVQAKLNMTTRPIAASYRSLQGITNEITSSFSPGSTASDIFYRWDQAEGHFRYSGCQPVAYADPNFGVNFNVGLDSDAVANAMVIEFWSNATTIRLNYYNIGRSDVWAIVDDKRILDGYYQHANYADGLVTWRLQQSTALWRKWRLGLPAGTFAGIGINNGSTIVPTAPNFQLAVIGDSYVQGGQTIANAISQGADGYISAGTTFGELAQETDLDVWRIGVSGTGYVADGGHGVKGPYGSTSRMGALADLPAMDAIVVWGSANDKPYTPSSVTVAAQSMWNAVHAARPDTPIIVIGPECTGWPDATLDTLNDALRVAASANPNVTAYVDLRNNNFMSGTGYDGSPQGDGNADVFIAADAGHLTHIGSRYWGQNIARLLGTVEIPANPTSGSF